MVARPSRRPQCRPRQRLYGRTVAPPSGDFEAPEPMNPRGAVEKVSRLPYCILLAPLRERKITLSAHFAFDEKKEREPPQFCGYISILLQSGVQGYTGVPGKVYTKSH